MDQSKWAKARAWKVEVAKVEYLRFGTTFFILATHGEHPFYEKEKASFCDARERPVKFYGCSIGYKDGHPYVRIATARSEGLADAFLTAALTSTAEVLASRFKALPFEPYGPVKVRLRRLLRRVNEPRRAAGLSRIDPNVLPTKRRTVRPFARPAYLRPDPSSQRPPSDADEEGPRNQSTD